MDQRGKREHFRQLLVLALPIVVEEILSTLLQYVDTAMVGHLGAEATSSVSLTTTVNWLIGSIFSCIGVAVVAISSAAYGAEDYTKVRKTMGQSIAYVVASGLAIGFLAVFLSPYIPLWMRAEETIRGTAGRYFLIISLPMVFRASSIVFASSMRAVKDSRTPMAVNLGANVLNIVLNYLFIYPLGMGVIGAAIASAIAFTLGGITMFLLAARKPLLRFGISDLKPDRAILKETVGIALPAAATATTSCLGHVVFAGLVSGMGTTVFAAHSIALSAETIFYVPGYALRGATSTLIGISVGRRDKEEFKVVENQSVVLTVVMMALSGLLLYLFATPIMGIFTPDKTVVAMGARVLKLIALSEPLFGLMIVSEGIYYGVGDTKFSFIVETIGAWGIRILSTIIALRVFSTDLLGVWKCMFADNAFRALALFLPLLFGWDLRLFGKRQKAIEG